MKGAKKAWRLGACSLIAGGYLLGTLSLFSGAASPPALTDHVRAFLRSCAAAFEPWRNAEPGETATYLDLENRPAFCRYAVVRDNLTIGYLVARVGAPPEERASPVVEFGVGPPPDILFRPGSKEAAERAVGSRMSVDEGNFVYSGFGQYFFRYPYREGTQRIGTVTVDALSKKDAGGTLSPHYPDGLAAWRAEIGGPPHRQMSRESKFSTVAEVPQFKHRCTSQATAIGMTFGYWAEHGFPNLRRRDEGGRSESNEELIGVIAELCGTCSDRTAIELFASSRGYRARNQTFSLLPHRRLQQMSYEDYVSRIHDGVPLLLTVAEPGVARYFAAVGYLETGQGRFVAALSADHEEAPPQGSRYYVFFNWDAAFNEVLFTTILPEKVE
jgi:hypothetical protein